MYLKHKRNSFCVGLEVQSCVYTVCVFTVCVLVGGVGWGGRGRGRGRGVSLSTCARHSLNLSVSHFTAREFVLLR